MKFTNQYTRFYNLLTIALMTGAGGVLAESPKESEPKPIITQQLFDSPDEAVKALQAAVEAKDKKALRKVFGNEFDELLTGDDVQDSNNAERFAANMQQGCKQVNDGEDKISLEMGTNAWPMPIPLVKVEGKWHFDTAAGKEEIINRHIGKDELHAIGVCHAYVDAQKQYAGANTGGESKYARKFKSTPGKKDGLYWEASGSEPTSPFGPLVAEAHAEGYGGHKGSGPKPFHGYCFRILTKQGKDAPGGKMNYVTHGNMTDGFALVAYPEKWDSSGIMTFIVNQEGKVYQKNLGENTSRIAGGIKEFNPDNEWTLVTDEGVTGIVSEK